MELIRKYFPDLTPVQYSQFQQLKPLFDFWNERVNLISREDIDNLYEHHVLHSLSIACISTFVPGTRMLDIGTGGGFPGLPLAIFYPDLSFHLIDSIGKKISIVQNIAATVGLRNVKIEQMRAEELMDPYDYIISRAVAKTSSIVGWGKDRIASKQKNDLPNGFLLLKGGDLTYELSKVGDLITYKFPISNFFEEPYFRDKYIVYLTK